MDTWRKVTSHLQASGMSREYSVGSERVGAVPGRLRARPRRGGPRGLRTGAPQPGAGWGEGCGAEGRCALRLVTSLQVSER